MNININIEKIVLEGIDLSPSMRQRLQASLSNELSRLLSENGISSELQVNSNIAKLQAKINFDKSTKPEEMGQQIAQFISDNLIKNTL